MKFVAWYSIVVGACMFGQWGFFLIAGQVPEVHTEPVRLAFHLAAEAITALALLVSGVGLLRGRRWARRAACVALGLLCYTAIVSPGYFAQQGAWPMVAMFGVILALALAGLVRLVRDRS